MTGTGKSELARALWIGQRDPRICIDVKNDLGERLPGIPTIDAPSEVLDSPIVRAVPPDPSDERWYDAIYTAAFNQGDTLIWLDEANEVTKPNYVPKSIRKYVLQGRSRGCGHMACTPRPADVHPVFASQAGHVFVFRIQHPRDRKAISEMIGVPPAKIEALLDELQDYWFIHYETALDEAIPCAPAHDPDELTAKIAARYFGPDPLEREAW